MEKTWRWFGKKDKITLDMLRQIGVEGIVTALHDVPNGEIWTEEAINDLKNILNPTAYVGLLWRACPYVRPLSMQDRNANS